MASATIEKEGVDVRLYNIIYEAIEDIKKALEGLLEPTITEKVIGKAEVRDLFNVSKVGTIAGCYVTEGLIRRGTKVRLLRDQVIVFNGGLKTLRRFKDDVREVQNAYECGIALENFNDVKQGDVIECYEVEEVQRTL